MPLKINERFTYLARNNDQFSVDFILDRDMPAGLHGRVLETRAGIRQILPKGRMKYGFPSCHRHCDYASPIQYGCNLPHLIVQRPEATLAELHTLVHEALGLSKFCLLSPSLSEDKGVWVFEDFSALVRLLRPGKVGQTKNVLVPNIFKLEFENDLRKRPEDSPWRAIHDLITTRYGFEMVVYMAGQA